MLLKLRVLISFLKGIGLPMLLMTLACAALYVQYRTTTPIILFFLFKIMADVLIMLLWYNRYEAQLYYYYNLGIRKRALISFTLLTDLLSFVFLHLLLISWL